MMKLFWSPRSPFVRKVMIFLHETGLVDRVETVRLVADTQKPNPEIMAANPLSQIPTLILDDGTVLYDSPVICEYLDTLHQGPKFFPAPDAADRFVTLRRLALGDNFLSMLLLYRTERSKPEELQFKPVMSAYGIKSASVFDALEQEAPALAAAPYMIGHLAIGCALAYVDFRFPDIDWRAGRPQLAALHEAFNVRPAVKAVPAYEDGL